MKGDSRESHHTADDQTPAQPHIYTYVYTYICVYYTTRIHMLSVHEVYIRSYRISTINRGMDMFTWSVGSRRRPTIIARRKGLRGPC